MNVASYLSATGISIYRLAKLAGVSYTTIWPHVRHGKPVGLRTARKLEASTNGQISAAEVLGLSRPAQAAA